MQTPLVTVVCLCYNHERFVEEALQSVFQQTYPSIQLIVIDDCSTDKSTSVIQKILEGRNGIPFIRLTTNMGNCKAFNMALPYITGKYFIDFACDDVMLPERIARQVAHFESLSNEYGLIFTDSIYINQQGDFIRNHYDFLFRKKLLNVVPVGDVFIDVLERYFISSPTMMIRTEVIQHMNGYDEELAYEDFDLWVRSSRDYKFSFLNERLTKVRKSSGSMSTRSYGANDKQLLSTYKVCLKAKTLLRTDRETQALANRTRYELRHAVFSDNKREARLFFDLLNDLRKTKLTDRLLQMVNRLPIRWRSLRKYYHRWRYD